MLYFRAPLSVNSWEDLSFSELWFYVPFGARFSFSAFALGGGLTYNIPISSLANSTQGNSKEEDKDFSLNSHLGWYVDIGFDLSGINGRSGGFGMMLRASAPLSSKIGKTKSYGIEYKSYSHLDISLVFQAATQLGSYPIGGQ